MRSLRSLPQVWMVPFSAAEKEVVPFVLKGMTDKEIAIELGLETKVVSTRVNRACLRTGSTSRVKFIVKYLPAWILREEEKADVGRT